DIDSMSFEEWWKGHHGLFEDCQPVRLIDDSDEFPVFHGNFSDPLYFEVHLSRSPTELAGLVEQILHSVLENHPDAVRKSFVHSKAKYAPSIGSEPRQTIEDDLIVYRDVYLANPKVKGKRLLELVRAHFAGSGRRLQIGLFGDAPANLLRSLRRVLRRSEQR